METTETKTPFNGTAVTGAALGGSALLVSLLNGGLGNILGGGMRPPAGDPPWARDLNYERELTKANAELGQVKAEKYADAVTLAAERRLADKIEAVEKELKAAAATQAVLNAKQEAFVGGLAAQVASFDRMTARYIVQPVMAASEAAAAAFAPKGVAAATTTTTSGS